MAAPADQHRIAVDGAHIVRETGVLDQVATILEAQAMPYRQTRELGQELPLAGRIIKVANAYDDLAEGRNDLAHQETAMERIHLGLGYEYDPLVARHSPTCWSAAAPDAPASLRPDGVWPSTGELRQAVPPADRTRRRRCRRARRRPRPTAPWSTWARSTAVHRVPRPGHLVEVTDALF